MTFRRQLQLPREIPVMLMNDAHIERAFRWRFLEEFIDEKFKFDQHIRFVVSKISSFIFILNKLRNY